MPKLELLQLAALVAAGALGTAHAAGAEPNDTVFVQPASATADRPVETAAPPTPSADDLRALASSRSGATGSSQFAGSFNVGSAAVAIPHGQIPGVGSSSVFGSAGAVVSGSALSTGPLAGASFGVGVSTYLPTAGAAAQSLGTPSPSTGAPASLLPGGPHP